MSSFIGVLLARERPQSLAMQVFHKMGEIPAARSTARQRSAEREQIVQVAQQREHRPTEFVCQDSLDQIRYVVRLDLDGADDVAVEGEIAAEGKGAGDGAVEVEREAGLDGAVACAVRVADPDLDGVPDPLGGFGLFDVVVAAQGLDERDIRLCDDLAVTREGQGARELRHASD
ncbi:hypothetical protein [Sorangium sp. So ce394]|uniref:hypothetical protein n=1 Tax=Sorangium sp. So ce394 TaxID=3133310 RepID=UPI003F5C3420